ncbi:uncharacterized protein LOC121254760 [Juglans microcarpa x Juglans regia]|uniref:uncharacterized protein LOC121254760 n=1 Tax=Juglans microcarpa x Juglans regia TaxID=2249226 RepID=UPI001B7F606F|nr:uncharacterized protein LOC121254760 [Juglans microcarpa x Juglans regia]
MADCAASDVSEGPVLSLLNKRLRALRKKQNRILQMEEAISQGKPINKEQEEVLRSKPAVSSLIDELEKLRQPLSQAVSEELSLAAQRQQLSSDSAPASTVDPENSNDDDDHHHQRKNDEPGLRIVEDLLHLLYFGSLFDVKSQSDFTATILTRTHERGCCLTYDYVTDDATDLLGERDLNSLSALGGLLISRPVDSGLSHKNALQRCIEHAKLWLANSDQPIEPNSNLTYSDLRERLNKIMASDYFTTTPEMKDPVEVAAAAAAGNYASFQVPISAPTQVEGSVAEFQHSDQNSENFQGHETGDDESSPVDELQKDEERENAAEIVSVQQEQTESLAELEHSEIDPQSKAQQYIPRRMYQNQRGGRGGSSGGGRRGYSNGRGGRGSGRGSGTYVNGRNQYYEQPGNYYPRNIYNNRGRGGRGGGQYYNNHGSAVPGGHSPADVGVRS